MVTLQLTTTHFLLVHTLPQKRERDEDINKQNEALAQGMRVEYTRKAGSGAYRGSDEENGGVLQGVPAPSPRHVWPEMHRGIPISSRGGRTLQQTVHLKSTQRPGLSLNTRYM